MSEWHSPETDSNQFFVTPVVADPGPQKAAPFDKRNHKGCASQFKSLAYPPKIALGFIVYAACLIALG